VNEWSTIRSCCASTQRQAQDFVAPQGDYAKEWTADLDTADATGRLTLWSRRREDLAAARSLLVLRKTA
jgi:glycogen operon protein